MKFYDCFKKKEFWESYFSIIKLTFRKFSLGKRSLANNVLSAHAHAHAGKHLIKIKPILKFFALASLKKQAL